MPGKINLLVIPSWYLPDGGYFFREHAEALAREGCKVDVLINRLTGMSKFRLSDIGYLRRFAVTSGQGIREIRTFLIKIPFLDRLSIRLWISRYVKHFEKYLDKYGRPDLVLAHSSIWAGAVALWIRQKYNIPYLLVEHRSRFILNTPEARAMLKDKDLPLIYRSLTGSTKIITVSGNLKKGLISLFPDLENKILTIPNMVDTEYFNYTTTNKATDPFVFLYAGILEKVKGLDILFRALRILMDGNRNVRLRIVGRGSQHQEIRHLLNRLGIAHAVTLTGYLDRQQLLEEYQHANAFVLPSRFEAFGVVLIEAMAAGLPVIATRSGGPENIVRSYCGVLTEKENTDDLARAMSHVMDHYEEYKADKIRETVVKNYSMPVVAGKYIHILSDILHGK